MPPAPTLTSTQFTQTQPHANSKPQSSSRPQPSRSSPSPNSRLSRLSPSSTGPSSSFSSPPPSSTAPSSSKPPLPYGPAPPGETPQQKVARLRAAAREARLKRDYNPVEVFLARSRSWADIAHRTFTYGLIGATGVAAVVMLYSVYDLIGHNRRQKALFITRELEKLKIASIAVAEGTATQEQIDIVKREALTREEAEKKRRAERKRAEGSLFTRGKRWLFGGMEMGDEILGEDRGGESAIDGQGRILNKVEEIAVANVVGESPEGGSLDKMAGNIAGKVEEERRGWWESIWRKGGKDQESAR